ncbi:MAG: hypothetical protein L0Y55_15285, partial [Anaerolineales bacterium]|nr:hypothetical protein [Anaerolineales bacterium]
RLAKWRAEIQSITPNIPFILAGNKSDLGRQVSTAEGIALAQAWRVPFFETSCLHGDGVREFFHALAHVAMNYTPPEPKPRRMREVAPCH